METSTKTVKDPCIWCEQSTAFGSGRFVNRIPADRDDEEATIDGWGLRRVCGLRVRRVRRADLPRHRGQS